MSRLFPPLPNGFSRGRAPFLAIIFPLLLLLLLSRSSIADPISQTLPYQGKLTTPAGTAVPNASYSVTFQIYENGTSILNQTKSVTTLGGVFATTLSITGITFDPAKSYDMGVTYNGTETKFAIGASPFAISSLGAAVSGTAGGDLTGTYPNPTLANSATSLAKVSGGAMYTDGSKVGIGTTTPDSALTVKASGFGLTHTDGTHSIATYLNPLGAYIGTVSNDPLFFYTNNSGDLMTLTTGGDLGVGTSTPAGRLQVMSPGTSSTDVLDQVNWYFGERVDKPLHWQSFTASRTGLLRSLTVVNAESFTGTLTVYSGSGTGGAVLFTGPVQALSQDVYARFPINGNVTVTSGQTYTWAIATSSAGPQLWANSGDSYPGGSSNFTGDYAFATSIAPIGPGSTSALTVSNTTGSVGVGTTTPAGRFDVVAGSLGNPVTDQNQPNNDDGFELGICTVWQSFIPEKTGYMTRLNVKVGLGDWRGAVLVLNGEGLLGTPMTVEPVQMPSGGSFVTGVDFSAPPFLVAGQKYTWAIDITQINPPDPGTFNPPLQPGDTIPLLSGTADPYADGVGGVNDQLLPDEDWTFNTVMVEKLTGDRHALYVDPDKGYVGIGTSSPLSALDVNGTVRAGLFSTVSDGRYKKDITPLSNALSDVMGLRGVSYDFQADEFPGHVFPAGKQTGFIAQEVEKILPNLVTTDEAGYKAVNYQGVVPILVEGMKQQQAQLAKKDAQIFAMEKRLNRLEKLMAGSRKGGARGKP